MGFGDGDVGVLCRGPWSRFGSRCGDGRGHFEAKEISLGKSCQSGGEGLRAVVAEERSGQVDGCGFEDVGAQVSDVEVEDR